MDTVPEYEAASTPSDLRVGVAILVRVILGSGNQEQGLKGSDGVLREFKDVLQNRIIIIVSMVAFLSYFVYSGIQPLISDLLSLQPFLVNPGELGIMFSVVSFTAIFFSLLGGFLLDRFNDGKILGLACAVTLGVTCLLIFGNTYLQYFLLLPFLYGFNRVEQISLQTLVVRAKPKSMDSVASIFNFFCYTGFAAAPLVLGLLYNSQGISVVYLVNIGLLLVSMALILLIQRHRVVK